MKLIDFIKDKIFIISVYTLFTFLTTFFLIAFNTNYFLIVSIIIIFIINFIVSFLYEYMKRRNFYNYLNKKMVSLDQKYLIVELINGPNFFEAVMLKNYLYDINKSYIESINKYKYSYEEFKEYIELWCHEIKTPITTTKLIIENNKNKIDNRFENEINLINYYVEQVLFYARSGNPEKDYLINKTNLKNIVNTVIKKNKQDIMSKKIKIIIFQNDVNVYSDSKWLEFIINQIIINSIKYSKEANPIINIDFKKNQNNILLVIADNGIGINSSEINRVFDKGFTGSNGRKKYNSTGIGLYLCKKLCDKLGHNIIINSKENENTKVTIIFPNNSLIDNVK